MIWHNGCDCHTLREWEEILDLMDNVKEMKMKQVYDPCPYAPWYVIAWRMVWIIPLKISREAFLLFALLGWGFRVAEEMRRITR